MWHLWSDAPPCIPNVPIRVRLGQFEWMDTANIHAFYRVSGLEWCETGVYREQRFEDIGVWQ